MTERMEERVETLLKKAEDFRRHGEDGSADAALELAERIMTKYAIDAAVIAARQQADSVDEIVDVRIDFTGIYKQVLAVGFDQVARAFNFGRSFIVKRDKVHSLHVIGYESAMSQLRLLITSLHLQAIGGMNLWWRTAPERDYLTGMQAYKARRQFVYSFTRGAAERIERARQVDVQETEPGTALVLSDQRSRVDAFVDREYNLTPLRSRVAPGTVGADRAGREAGRRANVGETPVGSGRRQLST